MKKRILLMVLLTALCSTLFAPMSALASGANSYAADYRYFESYDVNIKVQENNVLLITETIVADYSVLKTLGHGIIRSIPTTLDFTFPDETSKTFRIIVSDIKVPGQQYTKSSDQHYIDLKIGDPDRYATGKVTYVISYKYDIGYDYYDKEDFFYFNIIGTEWNADIKNATFTVEFPKPFPANKVAAYSGRYGSKDPVELSIVGNTISGSVQNLGTSEGITLDVALEEGYFVNTRKGPPFVTILIALFALIVIASAVLFLLFGKDGNPVTTVEFTAPDGMTPSEVGYIIDGSVDNKDITSLIIYWADKGYLKLEEQKNKDIEITKVKDLSADAKDFESTMFSALFRKGDSVKVSSLKDTFYTTMETMKTQVKSSFRSRAIFTKISMSMQGLIGFLTAVPIVLSFFFALYYDSQDIMISGVFSFFLLGLILGPVYALISLMRSWRGLEPGKRMFKLVVCIVLLSVVSFGYLAMMGFMFDLMLLGIASLAATLLTAMFAMVIRKRTDSGLRLFGQILGLRHFIDRAEKDRIEKLVAENPNYFYSILPYAYVLGVTDKWAKNFDAIGLQPPPPVWYSGYYRGDIFSTMVFMHMINNSMNSINTSFVSRPAPKGGSGGGFGGGGFGGGGFSGGGFGGGGGGGW